MELRPDASQKENVSPRPAAPLRPGKRLEQRRLPKSLGSGHGQWVPGGQAARGEPATTPSPREALHQKPCQVQSNLASPRPRLGLALKDTTGRLINSRFQQQSNLQPLGVLPPRGARAFTVQQSNLSAREAGLVGCGSRSSPHPWLEPQEDFWPRGVPRGSPQLPGPQAQPSSTLKPSWLQATDTPYPHFRPTLRYAPADGHTQPGPRSWGGLENWPSKLMGEPLTLDDLAVPVKSPAQAPPQAATSRLLASGQHLEQEAARLRCWEAQEPPGPSPQEPWTSGGQALPAGPQCTQPVLTFCNQRRKLPRGLRGAMSLLETPGVQASALEVLTGGFPDSVQGLLPADPLRRGQRPACSREQTGEPVLPQENKAGNLVNLESRRDRRQLLSRCFRAWQHLVRRRQAAALGHQQRLLHRGLQALRWALRAREAHLEVACGGHRRALLAQSFRKWRNLAQQQKQGQPHIQPGPGPPPSGEGHGRGHSGRKPVVDPAQRSSSSSQGVQQRRMLRRILRAWRLRVWGPGSRSGSARATSASELLGSSARIPPAKVSRAPALLETLRLSFVRAAGRQQQARCLLLWQVRAQQSRGAARWHQHTLQRRVFLGWSHWSVAQGAQRKLAARWAWDRSCRDALGLWRLRLAQWQEAEQWAQERGRRRVRDALQHWRSSWQRQQCLRDRYQGWVQLRRQGLCRAAFQSWQQAVAHQRHRMARPERLSLQSHFQAWCGSARVAGTLRARCRAFQASLRRRALGASFATWQEARVAAARVREHRMARASIALWRSRVQWGRADRQLRRARAQQAFMAWRVALGQRSEARQQAGERTRAQTQLALCWTLWVHESRLHRLSRAHAARKLSARVLEAWAQSAAQGRVQRVAITQFQLVGHRQILQTHWAQWRTELLSVWLEPQMEAQETSTAHSRPRADLTHWPGLASRGRLLALMDTAAPWKQTRSCGPQGTGPRLPSPAQHRSPGGQRKRRETSWAQSDSAAQLWMQRPGPRAQGRPPPGPGGDCSSEGQVDKRRLGSKYLRRWHLEALLHWLQGSQQARRLAGTWQCWVDAQGAEELARLLLRQWRLRWVWRAWRRRVVQLQVARRLQQRAEGPVLAQAFEKWHQKLAARGLRRSHQQREAPE